MPRTASSPKASIKKPPKASSSQTSDFLLEIGTEELPWQMIQPAMNQLAELAMKKLAEQRITHGEIRKFGTPRRLAILIMGMAQKQTASSQEIFGPSKGVAFDAHGQPTRAAQGFAQSQGVNVTKLEVRETPKGAYVCAVVRQTAKATSVVLQEHFPQVCEALTFSKTMRWNQSGMRFPRPIRWVLALLGAKALKITFAGLESGSRSWGHRFLGPRTSNLRSQPGIVVKSPASYESTLKKAGVVVDPDGRRKEMQALITKLAKSVKGMVYSDHAQDLLEQAVFSVECPNIVCGRFDRKYLALPQEILITAMREHQGFFAIVDGQEKLLPWFLAPTNMNLSKNGSHSSGE